MDFLVQNLLGSWDMCCWQGKGDRGYLEIREKECCWAGGKNLEKLHFVACAVHCGSGF